MDFIELKSMSNQKKFYDSYVSTSQSHQIEISTSNSLSNQIEIEKDIDVIDNNIQTNINSSYIEKHIYKLYITFETEEDAAKQIENLIFQINTSQLINLNKENDINTSSASDLTSSILSLSDETISMLILLISKKLLLLNYKILLLLENILLFQRNCHKNMTKQAFFKLLILFDSLNKETNNQKEFNCLLLRMTIFVDEFIKFYSNDKQFLDDLKANPGYIHIYNRDITRNNLRNTVNIKIYEFEKKNHVFLSDDDENQVKSNRNQNENEKDKERSMTSTDNDKSSVSTRSYTSNLFSMLSSRSNNKAQIKKQPDYESFINDLYNHIKDSLTSSIDHYDIGFEPILNYINKSIKFLSVLLKNEKNEETSTETSSSLLKIEDFTYKLFCYFIFSFIPNTYYTISKPDSTKQEDKFGLYNPVLFYSNFENSTKSGLAFIENLNFRLKTQVKPSFLQIELLVKGVQPLFEKTLQKEFAYEKLSVNFKFGLFVYMKRVFLLVSDINTRDYLFNYNDLFLDDNSSSSSSIINPNLHEEESLFSCFYSSSSSNQLNIHLQWLIFKKILSIFRKNNFFSNLILIISDFLLNKLDSDEKEIMNFFLFLLSFFETTIKSEIEKRQFDLTEFLSKERKGVYVRNPVNLLYESIQLNRITDINDGFINSFFVSAAQNRDFIIYLPENSILQMTSTILHYDGLIHIYKYIPYTYTHSSNVSNQTQTPTQTGTKSKLDTVFNLKDEDKFIVIQKDQKIESDFTPFELNLFSYKRNEIYKITFENYFSWLNGKEYKLKLMSFQLETCLSKKENHNFHLKYKIENLKGHVFNKITEFVFGKYENFLGKDIDKYFKKSICVNLIPSYESIVIENILKISNSNKTDEKQKKTKKENEISSNESSLSKERLDYLKQIKQKNSISYTSNKRGNRIYKLDKIMSTDVILKSYIKNVFIRMNTKETELVEEDFITELRKFEDSTQQFLILSYFFLKQNKDFSLGDYFEKETFSNSNIVFLKFSLSESALLYLLFTLVTDNEKIPEYIIYIHFDKTIDNYAYSIYSNGDIINYDLTFDDENSKIGFFEVMKKIINAINFNDDKKLKKNSKSTKKLKGNAYEVDVDESLDEKLGKENESESNSDSDSNSDDEKMKKLNKWKIYCSYTGDSSQWSDMRKVLKSKVKELNEVYINLGKSSNSKRIKINFMDMEFIENMTSIMHCFEM